MRKHTNNNGYGFKADPAWVDAGPRPDIHRLRVETNFRHSVLVADDPLEARFIGRVWPPRYRHGRVCFGTL